MNRLLIHINCYNRKSFTQGTIKLVHQVKPRGSQIVVCDNGSTDGTREWLEENQEKYELGLMFPNQNLRCPGSWKLLTKYFSPDDFDYVLPLDNDAWFLPQETDWYSQCLDLFNSDPTIGSLGLHREMKPGHIVFGRELDPNFNKKYTFKNFEVYDTPLYAAFRLDKFSLFHQTMKNWPHQFIGDKIGRHYNSLGYRTLKITPGFIVDISEYNFNNKDHEQYNQWFFDKERDGKNGSAYQFKMSLTYNPEDTKSFVLDKFGEEYVNLLIK
jgi:glycosyltransferase involved in cell wall biosynthesis